MKVVFILKGDPFSWKAHEAFRIAIAVGMNHELTFVLIRDGVYTLTRWSPEELGVETFEKFYDVLEHVNIELVVEDASIQERGLKEADFVCQVKVKSAEEISELINSAEVVYVW
ncbi:tRNA 2-thiouridine synthesizing protein C [Hydrogenivirga caldilitoris]|uniref:tRNA 2-thiouridine synthesizing protein C n=1 Tax=Hydrogenivirga caldilitoris TaxID=246264 RepID=A0A497XWS2_9AQUI|nr:DsrE family protein [Hydrogenivirga caldilitoris]RLJ71213.1 tRNA 2-thiouridine synthesizing protein C [Hydrogenivirga caldilitoris]